MAVSKQYYNHFIWGQTADIHQELELFGQDYQHLVKVSRSKEGDCISVSNGQGQIFNGIIKSIQKRSAILELQELAYTTSIRPKVSLAVALLKGRDLEEVVDLCCQLPIDSITPLITERSQNPKRDLENLQERLESKSITGLKQAHKPWLTEIRELTKLPDFLENHQAQILLLEPTEQGRPQINPQESYTLLSGPEGGFSDSEIQMIKEHPQTQCFHLGSTILRAKHVSHFALGVLQGISPELF